MQPTLLDFLSIEVNSPDKGVAIIAAAEDTTGIMVGAVEIGNGCQKTLTAVAIRPFIVLSVGSSPVERTVGFTAVALVAVRIIEDGMDCLTSLSIEDREVLLSTGHTTVAVPPVLGVAGRLYFTLCCSLIDIYPCSVLTSGSRLTHQLCLAVAVKVIDHELRIMGTGTDIHA